ncbi:MAG: 1,4-alpha-glucan branching protein GlgB [Christensenellales bacterium]|jgi:1,4-alpha-glucan branching enzyme
MYGIGELDLYLFGEGTAVEAYKWLGCHKRGDGHSFAVFAPNAKKVSLVGDFNEWNIEAGTMEPVGGPGIWASYVEGLENGANYKYAILTQRGDWILKADPFARHAEVRPGTASKVWHGEYEFNDSEYMEKRKSYNPLKRPMSIYEVHIGSWRRGENSPWLRTVADELVEYVRDMGYTHIEVMPVSEYPLDDSWGYQVTGYYAVTSRYGTPEDFKYFVDVFHRAGIGVILDWVPAHFPKDAHGLARFDGTALFEHEDPKKGEHYQWGTLVFDYGRPEVRSFLLSNAFYWLEEFHIDGLRVDAVSSMIYLDYDRQHGQWIPNTYGGRENIEAIEFLRQLNKAVLSKYPGVIMAAEESTAWPLVTKPPEIGGLGFNFKWNMGWMNDILEYMQSDHYFRGGCHDKLTFSMYYAFSENFILPLSHDEVVHGKKSLLDKMFGDYSQKFGSLKALYGYMFAHPGKKLMFMGGEIGQFVEWKHYQELDWMLLGYESHEKLRRFVKDLNSIYCENKALWELEDSWEGFSWLVADDMANSVVAFERISETKTGPTKEKIIVVINFMPFEHEEYRIGMTQEGVLKEILNSDYKKYGGSGIRNRAHIKVENKEWNDKPFSAVVKVPPLAAVYFEFRPKEPDKKPGRKTV